MRLRGASLRSTLDAADSSFGLVEVSKTANPRDSHHRWEGRVYSTGASTAGFQSFEEVVGDQINDYNCGHRIRVFNPNIGRRFSDPLEGTGYTAEESAALHTEQAKLENDIRKLKREHEVLHSLSLDTKDVNRRLKAKRAELGSLLNDHPKILSRREWREYTYEKARRELGLYGKVHIDEDKRLEVQLADSKRWEETRSRLNANKQAWVDYKARTMDEEKLSIRAGAQRKHIKGTREYEQHVSVANRRGFQKPSRITISIDEAEELVRKHAGTGKMKTTRDGKWNGTEICAANKVVGFIVRKDGTEVPTRLFKIHYSKNGTHIVPFAKEGKPWNGRS